jgi:predicted enzyme related to lactoylglutathione lyase
MQKNPIVFWELASHDADKSVKFFKEVFDWKIKWDERIGFFTVEAGEDAPKVDGGIFTLRKAKLPFLTFYLLVKDIEGKAIQVDEHGGFIVEALQEIPGGSKICLFNEPCGVTFAMLQRAK